MSTPAERMAVSRQRRRDGTVKVEILVSAAGVECLVFLGWLSEAEREDRTAVQAAMKGLLREAFVRRVANAPSAPSEEPETAQP